jgi:predicted DNA-binding transcriptional regulator YafY
MLSTLRDKRRLLQYVSISPQPRGKGAENIRPLLTAMERGMVIRIVHAPYQSEAPKAHNVEPYQLKEFEGRWYLFGYCKELKSFRTFGLDRFTQIELTEQSFQRTDSKEAIVKKFDDVYGLIYEPNDCANAPIEKVKLKFSSFLLPYITSLPLHHSQYITNDVATLHLIINPELENKIISFGEHVEVLTPETLRTRIRKRLLEAIKQYE